MNSKKVLLYTILFCIGAVSIGVFYGVKQFDKWKMREITKRAEEQRRLLAEQQALSLMKGQEIIKESNGELYKIMRSDKANDTVTNTFTALKKSGDLSKKAMYNIIDQHVEINNRIQSGQATGEDLTIYRNSLELLRGKLSKNPKQNKQELAKLNDLIADVDELDAKRNKKLKADNAAISYDGGIISTIVVPSKDEAYMQELRKQD